MAHRTGKPHEGRVPAEAPSESGPARRPPSPGRRSRPAADPARFSEVARQFGHDAILRGVDARLVGRAVDGGLLRRDEVHRLIPPSTLARKMREGRALSLHIYDLSMNVPGGETRAYGAATALIVLLLAINTLASGLTDRWLHRKVADA